MFTFENIYFTGNLRDRLFSRTKSSDVDSSCDIERVRLPSCGKICPLYVEFAFFD